MSPFSAKPVFSPELNMFQDPQSDVKESSGLERYLELNGSLTLLEKLRGCAASANKDMEEMFIKKEALQDWEQGISTGRSLSPCARKGTSV